jgi:hypothetical protein
VGGIGPHESALLVVGIEDMPDKTTSPTTTMRRYRKSWGFLGCETQDGKGERSQDHSPLN